MSGGTLKAADDWGTPEDYARAVLAVVGVNTLQANMVGAVAALIQHYGQSAFNSGQLQKYRGTAMGPLVVTDLTTDVGVAMDVTSNPPPLVCATCARESETEQEHLTHDCDPRTPLRGS